MKKYDFNKNANRWDYYERRYDHEYNKNNYGLEGQVYNFGIADINYKSPAPIVKAIYERAEKGTYSYSYVPEETTKAISQYYKNKHNSIINKNWIKIVHGTVNAMHQIVQALTQPKDYVLIQTPIYKPFAEAIVNNNRQIADNKLIYDQVNKTYQVDLIAFEKQIIEKKIKLFMLCNPHNPGAVVWDYDTLKSMVEICQKHQVIIFSDEVHSDIVFKSFNSLLCFNDYDQWIIANSPNKAFNLGGLKASYLIIKDEKIRTLINEQYKNSSITSPNVFVNPAFQVAYLDSECQEWLKQLKDHIWSNFVFLKEKLEKLEFNIFDLQSTYLVWVEAKKNVDELIKRLKKENKIVLCDYTDFYGAKNTYFRINIATSRQDLEYLISTLESIKD